MTPVDIPAAIMATVAHDWDIDWRGQSVGVTSDGFNQVVHATMPRWVGSPEIALNRKTLLAWRAIRAMAQGRRRPFRVPMTDRAVPFRGDVPFSTGSTFATGMGFAYKPAAICLIAAAAGATEIDVAERDERIRTGQFMSHADWPFLVTWRRPIAAGVRIGLQMPLRRAVPKGAEIMLRAHGLFLAAEEGTGNPAYAATPFSNPQLALVEWIDRR